jgi:hypothetical protein
LRLSKSRFGQSEIPDAVGTSRLLDDSSMEFDQLAQAEVPHYAKRL